MLDTSYQIYAAGSTATSAGTAHLLTGNYAGLSSLNNSDVVVPWLKTRVNSLRLFPALGDFGVRAGLLLSTSANNYIELKPMRAGAASLMHIANDVVGSNGNVDWVFWRRIVS